MTPPERLLLRRADKTSTRGLQSLKREGVKNPLEWWGRMVGQP